jgi:hypothetical protein
LKKFKHIPYKLDREQNGKKIETLLNRRFS